MSYIMANGPEHITLNNEFLTTTRLSQTLIHRIITQFALNVRGTHGVSHWARVLENGRTLAAQTGADLDVIELFAIFHDAKRVKEGTDHEHGVRGAEYAKTLWGTHFKLSERRFEWLYTACASHSEGLTEGTMTVQTCWDADRLDLGRVLKIPTPESLCTEAAKSSVLRQWGNSRSARRVVPSFVWDEWQYAMPSPSWIRQTLYSWTVAILSRKNVFLRKSV
jgi:uncharacterized protein